MPAGVIPDHVEVAPDHWQRLPVCRPVTPTHLAADHLSACYARELCTIQQMSPRYAQAALVKLITALAQQTTLTAETVRTLSRYLPENTQRFFIDQTFSALLRHQRYPTALALARLDNDHKPLTATLGEEVFVTNLMFHRLAKDVLAQVNAQTILTSLSLTAEERRAMQDKPPTHTAIATRPE